MKSAYPIMDVFIVYFPGEIFKRVNIPELSVTAPSDVLASTTFTPISGLLVSEDLTVPVIFPDVPGNKKLKSINNNGIKRVLDRNSWDIYYGVLWTSVIIGTIHPCIYSLHPLCFIGPVNQV